MSRKLAVLTLLVLASLSAFAATRELATREMHPKAGTVTGTVQRVDGTLIRLAGGLVTVDASDAQIVVGRGRQATVADIKPGMLLFASLKSDGKAATITATPTSDATLTGAVESVDVAAKTLSLLGYTVHVDGDTSFGGFRRDETLDLADVMPNQLVQVQVDAVNNRLVASELLVLSPVPPQVGHLRGTVRSIGTEAWEIGVDNETVTLVVNPQTKIAGSPKVGDTVEVVYNVNSANQKVAVSIIKFERPTLPKVIQFHGKVKSITGDKWVVTVDGRNEDKSFLVNEQTKLAGQPGVSDLVHVIASEAPGGTLTAMSVVRLRF